MDLDTLHPQAEVKAGNECTDGWATETAAVGGPARAVIAMLVGTAILFGVVAAGQFILNLLR